MPTEARVSCYVEGCSTTFARETERARHESEHHGDLKTCPVQGCTWRGAKRKDRVKKHLKDKHGESREASMIITPDFMNQDNPQVLSTQSGGYNPGNPETHGYVDSGVCPNLNWQSNLPYTSNQQQAAGLSGDVHGNSTFSEQDYSVTTHASEITATIEQGNGQSANQGPPYSDGNYEFLGGNSDPNDPAYYYYDNCSNSG